MSMMCLVWPGQLSIKRLGNVLCFKKFLFSIFFDFICFEGTRVFPLVEMDGLSLTGFGMDAVLAHTCGPVCSLVVIRYQCLVGTGVLIASTNMCNADRTNGNFDLPLTLCN